MFIRMIDEDRNEVWVNKNFIMAFEPSSFNKFKNYFCARIYGGNGVYKCYYILREDIIDMLMQDDKSMGLIKGLMPKGELESKPVDISSLFKEEGANR